MIVTLNEEELFLAHHIGGVRQRAAMRRGVPPEKPGPLSAWDIHFIGAAGELAAAKALGLYWNGEWGHDVGPYEVRTVSQSNYCLRVKKTDPYNKAFILVVTTPPIMQPPTLELVGWKYADNAQTTQYWKEHWNPAAFYVPQTNLNSMATLPHQLASTKPPIEGEPYDWEGEMARLATPRDLVMDRFRRIDSSASRRRR